MITSSSRLLFLLTNPISLLHNRPITLLRSARRHSLTVPLTTLSAGNPNHLRHITHHIPIKFSQNYYSRATNYALQENNHIPANGNGYHVSPAHPWLEWFRLLESLSVAGYVNGNSNVEDEFVMNENLSMEFVDAVNLCLNFARHRPDILGFLPRKDIEVLINDGYPFLFKSAHETERRMRAFLQADGSNVATLVDLMKYILSYVSNRIIYPERNINEATESSSRSLLQEMANFISRGQTNEQYEQTPRNLGPNITMKRGDWICTKCNFMNFARNTRCLECEETRPQRQLTNGDWDCPRRPDEASEMSSTYVQSTQPQNTYKEEKIERWFEKVKELHSVTTGPASAVYRDNFPQTTPMRKEENDFVDNKKNRPVSPYQRSTSSFAPFVPFPPDYFAKKDNQQQHSNTGANNLDSKSSIGNKTPIYTANSSSNQFETNGPKPETSHVGQQSQQNPNVRSGWTGTSTAVTANTDSYSNQFRTNMPKPETSHVGQQNPNFKSGWTGTSLEGSAVTEPDPLDMSEEAKAERWFKRVAQIKDISELSQIPDEDFPSIMPMRKGVNRFVVSKRKTPLERRLTSPQYRKNLRIMSSDPMKKEDNDDN